MNSILLILIFVGMATDTFATIYLNGFLKEARKRFVFKIAISIVLINMAYVWLGFSGGLWLRSLISDSMQVVAPAILLLLGLKIVIKSFNPKFNEMVWELTSTPVMLGYAAAVGINIFMLGVILPFLSASFNETLIAVAVVFAIVVTVAFFFGRMSHRFLLAMRILLAGGALVMGIGIFLILKYFNIL
ncbi:MAG TPA: manganese efflux pump [Bacteroidales bacterium]|nr:manganese efflux pump [Bacteroidales bacterium]